MKRALAGALVASACLLSGCFFGGGDDTEDEPTPTAQPTAAASPTASPTPSPTPDPLMQLPTTQREAALWLEKALEGSEEPACPPKLALGNVQCLAGLLDGDATPDAVYLVPVRLSLSFLPHPSAVFIWRGGTEAFEEFAFDLTADSSVLGRAFFSVADRDGVPGAEVSYIQNTCTATGCRSRPVLLKWDGTGWRDIGPVTSVANIDAVGWEGAGSASQLVVHGGKLPADAPKDAGPTRAATTVYTFSNGRFEPTSVERDEPEYLYHAIQDADELFETDKAAAIGLYRRAVEDKALKDWKPREDMADRRPALIGYALWRIALATAVLGDDPNLALDAVINGSDEPLFDALPVAFRRGFVERGGVIGGCAEVNLYVTTPVSGTDTPRYIQQLFDYGYANPPGRSWVEKMCPF